MVSDSGIGISQRCERLGVMSLPNAHIDEEQEREISWELEYGREVEHWQWWPFYAEHYLHPDVVKFVRTSVIQFSSMAFRCIVTTLSNSSTTPSEVHVWSLYTLAMADFCETIDDRKSFKESVDEFLRPVQ